MDGKLGGDVSLIARWAVFSGRGDEVIVMKRSSLTEPSDDKSYKALVAAHNRALEALSRDVAAVIRTVVRK